MIRYARSLIDDPVHRKDIRLWVCLLGYRQRVHGHESTYMFWNAVKNGAFDLPTSGSLSRGLWSTFLALGFEDEKVLQEIWQYADRLLATTGDRWSHLYTTIVQHMLLYDRGQGALVWHSRLRDKHPPPPSSFVKMCRGSSIQRR